MSSKTTGVTFKNTITESDDFNLMKYEYIYNGAGVGVADLNKDGLEDIIFAGNQVLTKIYLNQGNFKFKDITSDFKGLNKDQWYSGVAIADVNNDGWPDVYLTSTESKDPEKRKNRLWINHGPDSNNELSFTEEAEKYGIADTSQSVSAVFFDYDRDGYIDLYVLNNTVNSRMNTSYRNKITDGTAQNNDHLYHNNGDGTFTDVTKKAGILYEGFGLGIAIGDVNKDGYPDIYISNDFISNDLLYINNGDGTFTNEIRKYISYQSRSSMGDDMADINNDGNLDIYTLDMLPEDYSKRKRSENGFGYIYYKLDKEFNFEHQYVRNMLHLHNGFLNGKMLPYSEIGQYLDIYQTDWSWSPLFADFDNDGYKDLIIANGFPKDETDKDWTKMKVTAEGFYASDQILIDMAPAVKVPNLIYKNMGGLSFKKHPDWLPQVPSFSYGAAFVDLDNDGDLDYIVNNINDEAFILKNTTVEKSGSKSNYLRIKLTGKKGNTMALGAKVQLWANGKYQYMENFLTKGYASSVDPVIHFGLADCKMIDSVKIIWPDGNYFTVLKNIKTDQTIEINEKDSSPFNGKLVNNDSQELFFNKTENVIDYKHEQNDFADFELNQTILPHKFSQIGPRMANGDLNGDGKEDIIIGSTNTLPTKVFLHKGSKFVETEVDGLTGVKPFSESDFAIVDLNKDGANDVIAIAGGYENRNEEDYKHYLYENRNGKFERSDLPIPAFPASVVKACDFNHDGYIDLFIGSRVKKGMFPYANHSWLIINNKGKLECNDNCKLDLGMVTDAVWADVDNDGWEDLIVTREWNSVAILKNINGKKFEPMIIPEVENQTGLWYSIAAGDFNNDGYVDFVIGNLGENNRFSASSKYPLSLYALNLDKDKNIDPVITGYWPDQKGKMTEYPLNYLDELWSQSAFFKARFKDYATFSKTSIKEIFTDNVLKRLAFKLNVNTLSSYILWNEKGKFRWEKLPEAVQLSPIKKIIVTDLNGDKYPDIIMGGNDYSWHPSVGNYDANKGIVLINNHSTKSAKDQTSFKLLEPPQSGLLLQGMVESLLYLKGDTSVLVAGFNRDKAVTYEHVKK